MGSRQIEKHKYDPDQMTDVEMHQRIRTLEARIKRRIREMRDFIVLLKIENNRKRISKIKRQEKKEEKMIAKQMKAKEIRRKMKAKKKERKMKEKMKIQKEAKKKEKWAAKKEEERQARRLAKWETVMKDNLVEEMIAAEYTQGCLSERTAQIEQYRNERLSPW